MCYEYERHSPVGAAQYIGWDLDDAVFFHEFHPDYLIAFNGTQLLCIDDNSAATDILCKAHQKSSVVGVDNKFHRGVYSGIPSMFHHASVFFFEKDQEAKHYTFRQCAVGSFQTCYWLDTITGCPTTWSTRFPPVFQDHRS